MKFNEMQQHAILEKNKNILVSAAAGSGKTRILVERICSKVFNEDNYDINKILVMTFTKDAASEMKNRIKSRLEEMAYDVENAKVLTMNIKEDEEPISYIEKLKNENLSKEEIDKKIIDKKNKIINQISLLQNADISTIDSFCKRLVDNNFTHIDNFDPGYRVADEEEIKILIDELLEQFLEEKYDDKKYIDFFKNYFNRDNNIIKDLIVQGIYFLNYLAFPDEFLNYHKDTKNREQILKIIKDKIEEALQKDSKAFNEAISDLYEFDKKIVSKEIYNIIKKDTGKSNFNDFISSPIKTFLTKYKEKFDNKTLSVKDIEEKFPENLNFQKFNVRQVKDDFKEDWNNYKKIITDVKNLVNDFSYRNANIEFLNNKDISKIIETNESIYLELLYDFYKILNREKEIRKILSISDFQKYALRLMIKNRKQNEDLSVSTEYTDIGIYLQEKFEEIYVDEYQDTSDVQEELIKALSNSFNKKNVFLVGDLKQSIYNFRNAKPILFTEKLNCKSKDFDAKKFEDYIKLKDLEKESVKSIVINLDRNYRSHTDIIDFTNRVFDRTMIESFGGVDYSKDGRLVHGREEKIVDEEKRVEILVLRPNVIKEIEGGTDSTQNTDTPENNDDQKEKGDKKDKKKKEPKTTIESFTKEQEAQIIANEILELKIKKNISYNDICILFRAMSTNLPIYLKTFNEYNIPVIAETKTGFYDSYEVSLMLDLLRIINNPVDDIPLTNVLTSFIVKLSNEELAKLKIIYNKKYINRIFTSVYDMINIANDENDNEIPDDLKYKIVKFLEKLNLYQNMSRYKTISELLTYIFDDTGIYYYTGSLKNGDIREGNIDILLANAINYEKTTNISLFDFILYIEKLKDREIDAGNALAFSDDAEYVRITTIHKSKGLEYPIVFLPNLNKEYRVDDFNEGKELVLQKDIGVALNYIDYENKLKITTMKKYLVQQEEKKKMLEEEMRLFYVALTRAREKLILSYIPNITKQEGEIGYSRIFEKENKLPSDEKDLTAINRYIDIVNYAIPEKFTELSEKEKNELPFVVVEKKIDDIKAPAIAEDLGDYDIPDDDKNDLLKYVDKDDKKIIETFKQNLNDSLHTEYYYKDLIKYKPKFSVSELKKKSSDEKKIKIDYTVITNFRKKIEKLKTEKNDTIDDKEEITINEEHFEDSSIQNADEIKNRIRDEDDLNIIEESENRIFEVGGDIIGNTYHKFMEKFSFDEKDIESSNVIKTSLVDPDSLDKQKIKKFLNSDLAKEMQLAKKEKKLWTEQKFMKYFKESEILEFRKIALSNEKDKTEFNECEHKLKNIENANALNPDIIIQGIIDAFYIKEDGKGNKSIVIVDYKTDGLKELKEKNKTKITEEALLDKYAVQLEIYSKALESITKIKVSQKYIYSFALDKEIQVTL